MSFTIPAAGTVLGEFDAVLDRALVWRVDWSVGLDVPEYQDPEVARCGGHRDIVVPPGSLVFFSFIGSDDWLAAAGIRFDRSLAVRRSVHIARQLHVGDRVHGRSIVSDVDVRSTPTATVVKTAITTTYDVDGETAVVETVAYSTRHPEGAS
jgi:hypothetical protein